MRQSLRERNAQRPTKKDCKRTDRLLEFDANVVLSQLLNPRFALGIHFIYLLPDLARKIAMFLCKNNQNVKYVGDMRRSSQKWSQNAQFQGK